MTYISVLQASLKLTLLSEVYKSRTQISYLNNRHLSLRRTSSGNFKFIQSVDLQILGMTLRKKEDYILSTKLR